MNNFRNETAIYQRAYVLGVKSQKRDKQIICLETKQIYSSAQDAFNQTGISFKNISSSCLHKDGRQTAGGYHWEFLENCPLECCEEKLQERKKEHKIRTQKANSKPVYQYELKTGKLLNEYSSVSEASRICGGKRIHMENATSQGYYWSYTKADNYFDIKN